MTLTLHQHAFEVASNHFWLIFVTLHQVQALMMVYAAAAWRKVQEAAEAARKIEQVGSGSAPGQGS